MCAEYKTLVEILYQLDKSDETDYCETHFERMRETTTMNGLRVAHMELLANMKKLIEEAIVKNQIATVIMN